MEKVGGATGRGESTKTRPPDAVDTGTVGFDIFDASVLPAAAASSSASRSGGGAPVAPDLLRLPNRPSGCNWCSSCRQRWWKEGFFLGAAEFVAGASAVPPTLGWPIGVVSVALAIGIFDGGTFCGFW